MGSILQGDEKTCIDQCVYRNKDQFSNIAQRASREWTSSGEKAEMKQENTHLDPRVNVLESQESRQRFHGREGYFDPSKELERQ